MEVKLQVVGIFYSQSFDITDPGATVKTLLDAAVDNPGATANKFSYSTNSPKKKGADEKTFLSSFLVSYPNGVESRVLERKYPAGTYQLGEHVTERPAYTVWQYYMFDKDGKFVNPENKATPFVEQKLVFPDADGNEVKVARVSWRLVSILAQNTGPVATEDEKSYIAVG